MDACGWNFNTILYFTTIYSSDEAIDLLYRKYLCPSKLKAVGEFLICVPISEVYIGSDKANFQESNKLQRPRSAFTRKATHSQRTLKLELLETCIVPTQGESYPTP